MKLTKKQINFLAKVVKESWVINENGEVDVYGSVDMTNMNLTEIPVKFGSVSGSFYCSNNQLTSLEFAPKSVGGNFYCSRNNLTNYFKNIKEEDFTLWDRLNWNIVLQEYPFLINIYKNYTTQEDLKGYLEEIPQTKEYLITESEEDDKSHSTSNSIKIENGNLTLNVNNSEINFKITDKTNFNLTF